MRIHPVFIASSMIPDEKSRVDRLIGRALLQRTMNMQTRIRTELVLFVAIALASLAGCHGGSTANASFKPDVVFAPARTQPVRHWDEFNGRISAIEAVELRPRVSGYIERIAYREGAEVKRGDLLFVIDPRPYRAALDGALAELERARGAATLARSQEQRAQTLLAAKATSQEEYDARRATLIESDAQVHAAEAAVATARLNLEFSEVRAPIEGRASRARLTVGNLAQADQSVLTTLVSLNPVYVYFDCDEQTYLRYAKLARDARAVRVALANEQEFKHTGTVDFLDNQVETATGTIRARAVLSDPDRTFTPGLYARVEMEGGGPSQAVLIDDRAVLTDQDKKYVYVLAPGDKAIRKEVVPGRLVDGLREVQSGLDAGDKVIVEGLPKIFYSGMPVHPLPLQPSAKMAQD